MAKLIRRPPRKFWPTATSGFFTGGRKKEIAVAFQPRVLEIKLKGTRKVLEVSWESIYDMAIKAEVEANRLAKGR